MNRASLLLLTTSVALLSACVTNTYPPDNSNFGRIDSIRDLVGVYRNLGETGKRSPGSPPTFLSKIVWPSAVGLEHESIEKIDISLVENRSLLAKALDKDGRVIKQDVFVEGKDFTLRHGRIHLSRVLAPSFAYPAQNPLIGVIYEHDDIGLDEHGQGKYRTSVGIAGLVFLIPMAVAGYDDVRFVKLR